MKFWIARNKGKWGGLNLFLSKPTKKLDGTFIKYANPIAWCKLSDISNFRL